MRARNCMKDQRNFDMDDDAEALRVARGFALGLAASVALWLQTAALLWLTGHLPA